MPHSKNFQSWYLPIHLLIAILYGMVLPIWFGVHHGWEWIKIVPVAALWLLLNLPVIEHWIPRLLSPLFRRIHDQWRLRAS
ncbi:MAG: hypothetical protein AAF191_04650 [Verrucomicrobiota bacterium]